MKSEEELRQRLQKIKTLLEAPSEFDIYLNVRQKIHLLREQEFLESILDEGYIPKFMGELISVKEQMRESALMIDEEILKLLKKSDVCLTNKEISKQLGMNMSTVYGHLNQLVSQGKLGKKIGFDSHGGHLYFDRTGVKGGSNGV